jgi:hypothetical protein
MNPEQLADQQTKHYNRQLILLLLKPSWLSIILSFVVAGSIIGFLLFQGRYEGSDLQRQYLTWQSTADNNSLDSAASTLKQNLTDIIATVQVFIFWCIVGAAIYLFISVLYRFFQNAREKKQELTYVSYVRGSHQAFVRELYKSMIIRFASLAAWGCYALLTVTIILPYLLGAIHVADEHLPTIGAFCLLIGSGLAIMLLYHVHVIMLRLLLGRPRAFNGESDIQQLSSH